MKQKRWSKAQRDRSERIDASGEFWCSWGRHHTYKHRVLKEQFPAGTMCYMCQVNITENLRGILFMPEMTAAIRRQELNSFEGERTMKLRQKVWEEAHPDENLTGVVYYLRINNLVKIGFTTNLAQRSRAYPPGSELLAVEPATTYTERERHQDFSRWRAQGREWFHESETLSQHIESLVAAHGLPLDMMHKFTEHDTRKYT